MTESESQLPADEQLDEAEKSRVEALVKFARASASAFQGAMHFAIQSEQALASTVAALQASGLSVDDVAFRVGLARETVERLQDGTLVTHRLI
ncbi:hypothetical protein [uncultured Schumannella sp.]|uniref:hypothetical protein n=1 Tax=uncultured Schumannella sp. TaxID=1195956 RepID=UPI0025E6E219|nr:hypothetical protein [uncultured Schumannella sp.]